MWWVETDRVLARASNGDLASLTRVQAFVSSLTTVSLLALHSSGHRNIRTLVSLAHITLRHICGADDIRQTYVEREMNGVRDPGSHSRGIDIRANRCTTSEQRAASSRSRMLARLSLSWYDHQAGICRCWIRTHTVPVSRLFTRPADARDTS